jgi:hypothetical protein
MAIRKSSRVNDMSYDYQIIYVIKNLKVSELKKGAQVGYCWKVDDLKNDYSSTKLIEDKNSIDSFVRSQKWLLENHPEYMI